MDCNRCNRVKEFCLEQMELIREHLNAHKWYNGIEHDEEAIVDFANKYAWIMREVYCSSICKLRCKCLAAPKFNTQILPDITDAELMKLIREHEPAENLTRIEFKIVKKHIRDHKWFNKIGTYKEAVPHFIDRYGWIIRELSERKSVKDIFKRVDGEYD